ncbi:MAG: T9SS type A sorting domain-containing protein, partial [candidate division WOR-3 bacterium]
AGVEEERTKAEGQRTSQTICRDVLFLPKAGMTNDQVPMTMSDVSGRKIMDLYPGENDVRSVSPGVYFLRSADGGRSAVTKVVIQR